MPRAHRRGDVRPHQDVDAEGALHQLQHGVNGVRRAVTADLEVGDVDEIKACERRLGHLQALVRTADVTCVNLGVGGAGDNNFNTIKAPTRGRGPQGSNVPNVRRVKRPAEETSAGTCHIRQPRAQKPPREAN